MSIFREEEGTVVDLWLLETHPCDLAALEIVGYAEVTQPHLEWGFGSLFRCSDPIGQDFIQIFLFFFSSLIIVWVFFFSHGASLSAANFIAIIISFVPFQDGATMKSIEAR